MFFIRNLAFSFTKVKTVLNDPLFLGAMHRSPGADGEIEKAIRSFGVSTDVATAGDGDKRGPQFFELMRPLMEGFVREVRYSLTYFMKNFKEDMPAMLYLAGYGEEFRGLDPFLAKELGMETAKLLLPSKIQYKAGNTEEDPGVLSQCTGAVAGVFAGSNALDFTPLDFKNLKLESVQRKVLMLASVALVGLLAMALFFMKMQSSSFENRLNAGKRQLQVLGKVSDLSAAAFPRYYLASEIDRATVPADKLLRLLGYLLPEKVVLKRFVLDSSHRRMDLEVAALLPEAKKEAAVRDFAERLKETSFFSTVGMHPQGEFYGIEGEFRDA